MNMAQPVGSVGFPATYPYAQSMPLPSAILRPLQQPIYDTEVTGTGAISEIIFFQRQLGQTFANATSTTKYEADTNLQQPGQLANPVEFSLFGFFVEMPPDVTLGDYILIYKTSVFVFTYTGNRIYLMIPLSRVPQGVSPEGFSALSGQTVGTNSTVVHNGVGHVSNMYKFTIGRSALRIRPTESFQAKIRWPSASVTCAYSNRIRVILAGLTWTAL